VELPDAHASDLYLVGWLDIATSNRNVLLIQWIVYPTTQLGVLVEI
jgi:hypothetical protein